MGERLGSTLRGLPCWYMLLLRCNANESIISQTPARVREHLPDASRVIEQTTLLEFRVKDFLSLPRIVLVGPGAPLFESTRFSEG